MLGVESGEHPGLDGWVVWTLSRRLARRPESPTLQRRPMGYYTMLSSARNPNVLKSVPRRAYGVLFVETSKRTLNDSEEDDNGSLITWQ